ncbi:hypothetical protein CHCC20335_1536 [Bacillus paralicheniformis]|nr:hypothetical protein CHCC20335_1536 [Bacillus paralicheniformis]
MFNKLVLVLSSVFSPPFVKSFAKKIILDAAIRKQNTHLLIGNRQRHHLPFYSLIERPDDHSEK